MIVKEPCVEFEVVIPPIETEAIEECIGILDDIVETMNEHNCDSLDYGYADCPECITSNNIKEVADLLLNLRQVHTMF